MTTSPFKKTIHAPINTLLIISESKNTLFLNIRKSQIKFSKSIKYSILKPPQYQLKSLLFRNNPKRSYNFLKILLLLKFNKITSLNILFFNYVKLVFIKILLLNKIF